jgi:hypothetical protein
MAARRGKQRASVAVEHSFLTAVWHVLTDNLDYHDLDVTPTGSFAESLGFPSASTRSPSTAATS